MKAIPNTISSHTECYRIISTVFEKKSLNSESRFIIIIKLPLLVSDTPWIWLRSRPISYFSSMIHSSVLETLYHKIPIVKWWRHSLQISWLYRLKSKAAISFPFDFHCKAIAALFFFPYGHPIWGHSVSRLLALNNLFGIRARQPFNNLAFKLC